MKKVFQFLSILIITTLACDLSVTTLPSTAQAPLSTNTVIPTTEAPSPTAIPATEMPTLPASDGMQVFYKPLSLVLPTGLAGGISDNQIPRAEGTELPYWELTPGHTVLNLEGYLLQAKFHQPQIYVFPATEYAVLVPSAFESMHRLRNAENKSVASISAEELPAVPFFNAAQVFASNTQFISFQNGNGIRFLTEYAQYAAPVNNHDLIYHFQGFTSDGEYYIVVIFPITAPVLADSSDAGAVLPVGGIAYPDVTSPNPDFQGYYASITDLLNATSPEAFSPTINKLDMLIQSMQVIP